MGLDYALSRDCGGLIGFDAKRVRLGELHPRGSRE
jgi:hypothetical protein